MNLPDSKEIQELIRRCRKHNRKAQERLFKLAYPLALNVSRRYTQDLDEARSIVNEGMLKVFRQLETYSPDLSFGGWLRRIMVHSAIDHYRRRKRYEDRFRSYEEAPISPSFNDDLLDKISAEEILALVQNLSPAYRMVFSLYAVEGYTHREIAEQLGISEGTSKSNYAKARAGMQKALAALHLEKKKYHG
ncbi:RNA polymerase sigma-70 factor, ECF subfamily [Cyclobacterium lianum]|uniref:RNA polymerase sigma-70 factor, ECF subfamily n=1 Tax=Cyclobacterium lianum TaxID=388280 RepID=A0A1M7I5L6_9BACT|nr:sigma-70 family RNA polymerase sigma factor [Cyclobacterium lianum]SHM36071.1 RNA polymerase sigma-70 factor, ECF subfamily [Cyclobacterium lianum]